MNLVETLVMFSLFVNFVYFLIILYLFAKSYSLSATIQELKKTDTAIKKIMKTKIPIVMDENGQPMVAPMNTMPQQQNINPITG